MKHVTLPNWVFTRLHYAFHWLFLAVFIVIGSIFPLWLAPSIDTMPPANATVKGAQPSASLLPPEAIPVQLIAFNSHPVFVKDGGYLLQTYFYEGQRVTRNLLVAKMYVRSADKFVFLNAPANGIISKARFNAGVLIPAGDSVASVLDLARLRVRLNLAHATKIQLGDSVRLSLTDQESLPIVGKVLGHQISATGAILALHLRHPLPYVPSGTHFHLQKAPPALPTPHEKPVARRFSRS
jgi:hypothetical protein